MFSKEIHKLSTHMPGFPVGTGGPAGAGASEAEMSRRVFSLAKMSWSCGGMGALGNEMLADWGQRRWTFPQFGGMRFARQRKRELRSQFGGGNSSFG